MLTPSPMHRTFFATGLIAVAALFAAPVHAQWAVKDQDAITVLGDKKDGDINSNTKAIKDRLEITKGKKDDKMPGTRVSDPDQALPKAADTKALDDGAACKTVAKSQQDNCQKIVDIENAQYKFMLTMYETSKTRDDTLRSILTERANLDTSDYGKLEDNTNKLNALYTLVALDRQQMESVNYAYEANLRYLRAQQTQAANIASKGGSKGKYGSFDLPIVGNIDVGNLLGGVITGAVLNETLSAMKTTKPSGMQTLSITEGF